jgi:2-haloalkanoic acid dehalogenase type II
MSFNPTDYKVLSFDIYGTLIDWESGIYSALLPLLSSLPATHTRHPSHHTPAHTRAFILTAYTQLELEIQAQQPTLSYPSVLAAVYKRLAEQLDITPTEDEASAFGATIGTWPAFPDTVAAMQTLGKHYKLVVLSNVDKASFSRTLSGPLDGVKFDAIYTAEDIGSYKPDPRNLNYMIEHVATEFGAKKEEILKVAQSLQHDHIPARKVGLSPGIWIMRRGGESAMGGSWEEVKDQVSLGGKFGTLGQFAEVVEGAFGDA